MATTAAKQPGENTQERPPLLPDLDQARRFLTLLDENAARFTFQIATDAKPADKPRRDPLARHVNLSPDSLKALARHNTEFRAAVWVCINETDGRGRKRENVTRVRAVFLDGDGQVTLDQLLGFALEPHVVVESSPGHYQAYWLVDGLALEQFEGVQRGIAKTFGETDSITDLCRVMRVPGFWHQKDPARPFRVRIAHEQVCLPYQPADVLGAFPPASKGPKPNGRDTGASFLGLPPVPPDPLDYITLETLQADHPDAFDLGRYDGDQSRQDLALASLARRVGWPPVDAWRLIIAVRGDSKSIRRDYIERTLQKAYDQHADADPVAPDAEGDALFDLSHDGLALDMGRSWEKHARHVAVWGKWMFWTGARWQPDEKLVHLTRTRNYLRARADSLVRTAAKGKIQGFDIDKAEALAKQLRSAPMVTNVVGLARSNEELVATVDQWDADPFLLGTPAGAVDLRTGELRPARSADFITKCTAVGPAPVGTTAQIWQAFLERIFRHDLELIPFMQRAIGYSLCGQVSAHVLLFCWGQGGNGKGALLNTVSRVLGDYAAVAPSDLLLVTQSDRHPCDMAMLRGARMVTAQELAPGRAWDEPKLKSLTGGDRITARFMRQDFFTYEPQFTLFVAGNHKPSFQGVDEAIRRRVLLVPFLQVIPEAERDEQLPEKLKAEWPAILRWAIDGCLAWQREGLAAPESARAATKDYLDAEDVLGQWLEERCIVSPKAGWTALKTLYEDWCAWGGSRGHHLGTSTALGKKLDERGFERRRTNQGAGFSGIAVQATPTSRDESDESDDFCLMGRSDPLGARATDYGRYGEDHHFRHSHHPGPIASAPPAPSGCPDQPKGCLNDRVSGEQ
jgi:P4 family phage/plasmid primase-like protien